MNIELGSAEACNPRRDIHRVAENRDRGVGAALRLADYGRPDVPLSRALRTVRLIMHPENQLFDKASISRRYPRLPSRARQWCPLVFTAAGKLDVAYDRADGAIQRLILPVAPSRLSCPRQKRTV
jgi:hypothetical protein